MTAASPAKPPPTTMILGDAIPYESFRGLKTRSRSLRRDSCGILCFVHGLRNRRCEAQWRCNPIPGIDLAHGDGEQRDFALAEVRPERVVGSVVDGLARQE